MSIRSVAIMTSVQAPPQQNIKGPPFCLTGIWSMIRTILCAQWATLTELNQSCTMNSAYWEAARRWLGIHSVGVGKQMGDAAHGKSTESQPQCHSTTGRAPSFYAREPGPNAPAQLRPPTDALDRNDECSLSWSRFFQELQVQRSGDAKGWRHKHLHSRAGSNGGKPWSCASQLNRDALLLRRLSMYQRGYEYCLLIIFQRQRPQAQEANDDQRRRLQSHASCGGKPSCYGSEHDPVVHPLLRLTLRYLDRDEQKCPLHSVCFDQCDCQLHVNSKCGDHDQRAKAPPQQNIKGPPFCLTGIWSMIRTIWCAQWATLTELNQSCTMNSAY
ncbi:hypothetical protein MRX96_016923 [Rhipicephalus microplus]